MKKMLPVPRTLRRRWKNSSRRCARLKPERLEMLGEQEQKRLVHDSIKQSERVIDDGWDDGDPTFIVGELKRIFNSMANKMGWPVEDEVSNKLKEVRGIYSPNRKGLDSMREWLARTEKEWLDKISPTDYGRNGWKELWR